MSGLVSLVSIMSTLRRVDRDGCTGEGWSFILLMSPESEKWELIDGSLGLSSFSSFIC